jgi:hypothetical protein
LTIGFSPVGLFIYYQQYPFHYEVAAMTQRLPLRISIDLLLNTELSEFSVQLFEVNKTSLSCPTWIQSLLLHPSLFDSFAWKILSCDNEIGGIVVIILDDSFFHRSDTNACFNKAFIVGGNGYLDSGALCSMFYEPALASSSLPKSTNRHDDRTSLHEEAVVVISEL